jgi:hypothetical protein
VVMKRHILAQVTSSYTAENGAFLHQIDRIFQDLGILTTKLKKIFDLEAKARESLVCGTDLAHTRPARLRSFWPKELAMSKSKSMNNSEFSERTKQLVWFTSGALCGLAMLSICKASNAPVPSAVTDDTAIYQNLSEIQIHKESAPNFDSDISNLSKLEGRYQDRPALRQRPVPRMIPRPVAKNVARKAPAKKALAQPRS